MEDKSENGIIIDVGFMGDIKSFIKEVKAELERAEFAESLKIEEEFKRQYKGVKTIIDRLARDIAKIQSGADQNDALKQIENIKNQMNLMAGTIKAMSRNTNMSGVNTMLKNVADNTNEMCSVLDNATNIVNEFQSQTGKKISLGTEGMGKSVAAEVEVVQKALKKMESSKRKAQLEKASITKKGGEKLLVKELPQNEQGNKIKRQLYERTQKKLEAADNKLQDILGIGSFDANNIKEAAKAAEDYASNLANMHQLLNSIKGASSDDLFELSQGFTVRDAIEDLQMYETTLAEARGRLNDYIRTNKTSASAVNGPAEKLGERVVVDIAPGQRKKLKNQIFELINRVQTDVYSKPIEIILTTTTANFNKTVEKDLNKLLAREDIDTDELEALKNRMQKSFDKYGNIEIGINTRKAETKIKDFLNTVKGDLLGLQYEFSQALAEIAAVLKKNESEPGEVSTIENESTLVDNMKLSYESIVEQIKEKNSLLEQELKLLEQINSLTQKPETSSPSSLSLLEERYRAFKPFYENGDQDTKEGSKAALGYYLAYRNALYDKVSKGELTKLTLGKTKDLFTGNYTQWKSKDTPLDMSGLSEQIKKYSDALSELNPSSVAIITSISDALDKLLSSEKNTAGTATFLEQFSSLLNSLRLSDEIINIESLTKSLRDLKSVLTEGNVDLSFMDSLNKYLSHSKELADFADILRIGGKEAIKQAKDSAPVSSILNKPNAREELIGNASALFSQYDVTPLNFKMDTLKTGMVEITSLVRDADGEYAKFVLHTRDGMDMVVKSINDNRAALEKDIAIFEKYENGINPPTISRDVKEDALREKLKEIGISYAEIDKIIRKVTADAEESFQVFTDSGEKLTIGLNSKGFLAISHDIVDAEGELKRFDSLAEDVFSSLKKYIKSGGTYEFDALNEKYNKLYKTLANLKALSDKGYNIPKRFKGDNFDELKSNIKDSMISQVNSLLGLDSDYKLNEDYVKNASELVSNLKDGLKDAFKTGNLKDIETMLTSIAGHYNNIILKQQEWATDVSVDKLHSRISRFVDKNSAMGAEYRRQFDAIAAGIQNADKRLTKAQYNAYLNDVIRLETRIQQEGKTGVSVFELLGSKIKGISTSWAAQFLSMYDIIRYAREIATTVTELDSALTELRKVSDASTTRLQESFSTSAQTAQELGASIKDVINATADWSRLGYNVNEAEKLAEVATLYVNVGDNIGMEEANQSLISTLQGFQMSADSAESIVDKFNEVANNYAIDTGGIGEALQRSAASFNAANTSLSESIALVTGTNEIVQNPDRVGNMWKTVSARLRGAKAELQDMGEDTEGMVTSTSKIQKQVKAITGFDIMKNETEFKSIYDIVVGIGERWNQISDVNQAALLETLAGKNQSNAVAAALTNVEHIKAAYETAEKSDGSARREQANYERSVQYSIDKARAKLETIASNILQSDVLKNLVDTGSDALGVIDKITSSVDLLSASLAALFAIVGVRNQVGPVAFFQDMSKGVATFEEVSKNVGIGTEGFDKLSKSLTKANGEFFQVNNALAEYGTKSNAIRTYAQRNTETITEDALTQVRYGELAATSMGRNYKGNFFGSIRGISHYNSLAQSNNAAAQGFAAGLSEQNVQLSKFLVNLNGGTTSMGAYAKSLVATKAKTLALNVATGLAQGAIGMLVGVALSAAMTAFDNWIHRVEHAKEALTDLHDSYEDNANKLKDHKDLVESAKDEYSELAKGVDAFSNKNLSLSNSDYEHFIDLNNQLAEAFPSLKSGIDSQGNAILNLGTNAESTAQKLDDLIDKESRLNDTEVAKNIDEETKNISIALKALNVNEQSDINKAVTQEMGDFIKATNGKSPIQQIQELFIRKSHDTDTATQTYSEPINKLLNSSYSNMATQALFAVVAADQIPDALANYSEEEIKGFVEKFKEYLSENQTKFSEEQLFVNQEAEDMLAPYRQSLIQTAHTMTEYASLQNDELRNVIDRMINAVDSADVESINTSYGGDAKRYINSLLNKVKTLSDAEQQKLTSAFRELQELLNNSTDMTIKELYDAAVAKVEEVAKLLYGDEWQKHWEDVKSMLGLNPVFETVSARNKIVAQGSGKDFNGTNVAQFGYNTRTFDQKELVSAMDENGVNTDKELGLFKAAMLNEANKTMDDVIKQYIASIESDISAPEGDAESKVLSFRKAWKELDEDLKSEDYSGAFKGVIEDKEIANLESFKDNALTLAKNGQLSVKAFKDLKGSTEFLKSVGLTAEQVAKKINKLVDPVEQLAGMKSGITSITSAYDEKKEDKNRIVGSDTLNSMYSGLGVSEWGKKDLEVWEQYKKAATDTSISMKEFKKYQDDLATSYVNSENFLANLTEENKDYYQSLLTEMGVVNAAEVVNDALNQTIRAQVKAKKMLKDVDLKVSTEGEIEGLTGLENTSRAVRNELIKLWVEKNNVFKEPLDTQSSIDNLIALGEQIGYTASDLIYLNSLKRLQSGDLKNMGQEQIRAIEQGAERDKKKIQKGFKEKNKERLKVNSTKLTEGNKEKQQKASSTKTNTKATKTEIDWIEKKLSRLQGVISTTQAKLQNLLNYSSKNKTLNKEISQNEKLLKSYRVAVTKYGAQVSRAYKKLDKTKGVSAKEIQRRYNTGALSGKTSLSQLIKQYGEKPAQAIQAYLDAIDKRENARQGVQNTKAAIRQNRIDKSVNRQNYYDQKKTTLEAEKEAIAAETTAKTNEQKSKKISKIIKKNGSLEKSYAEQAKQIELQYNKDERKQKLKELEAKKEKEIRDYKLEQLKLTQETADAEANLYRAQMANALTANAKNSLVDKETKSIKESYKYQIAQAKLEGNSLEAKKLEEELNTKLVAQEKEKFDNTIAYYDNLKRAAVNAYQQIGNQIDVVNAQGLVASESLYKAQQKHNNTQLNYFKTEREEAVKRLKSIKTNTQEWYDARDEIQRIDDETAKLTADNYELDKSIRAVLTTLHEMAAEILDIINSENDLMIKYLSYGKLIKDGGYTAEGLATLSLYYDNAQNSLTKLKNTQADMTRYLKKTGKAASDLTGNELKEYNNLHQQEIQLANEYYDEMTKIADLEKERLESYKDYLQELINKRKELLQAEKDAYDYEKSIAEKTKTIATLQKQIQSISGDDSEGARSRIQELQVQLDSANEELRETEYNQWVSDQTTMLDNLYNEFADLLEKLEMRREDLIKDAMQGVTQNTETIAETIQKYMGENPEYTFSGYFNQELQGLGTINTSIREMGNQITNAIKGNDVSGTTSNTSFTPGSQTTDGSGGTGSASSSKSTSKTDINAVLANGYQVQMKKDVQGYTGPDKKEFSGTTLKKGEKYWALEAGKTKKGSTWLGLADERGDPNKLNAKHFLGWVPKTSTKKIGYNKGGTIETLKRMPLANNDDAWITVGQGERVLTPAQNANFEKLVGMLTPTLDGITKRNNLPATNINQSTNIGDINMTFDLPNVQNYNDLVKEMQRDQKFEKLVKGIIMDKNSMSKYNVRW